MTEQTELAQLEAVDLAELTLGLSFLFWSLLVFLLALTETLAAPALRPFPVIFLGGGGLGAAGGAYRLCRLTALGAGWRRRTRELAVATVAVAYLSLFYLLWRQVSTAGYLLGHALGFFGMVVVMLGLLCPPVRHLARAAGRRNLGRQCAVVGVVGMGRPTHFTRDEQYTLMTLWSIARSPLIFGGDMTKLDGFTLSLLTNADVIAVNQRSTENHQWTNHEGLIAWSAKAEDSDDRYVGVGDV